MPLRSPYEKRTYRQLQKLAKKKGIDASQSKDEIIYDLRKKTGSKSRSKSRSKSQSKSRSKSRSKNRCLSQYKKGSKNRQLCLAGQRQRKSCVNRFEDDPEMLNLCLNKSKSLIRCKKLYNKNSMKQKRCLQRHGVKYPRGTMSPSMRPSMMRPSGLRSFSPTPRPSLGISPDMLQDRRRQLSPVSVKPVRPVLKPVDSLAMNDSKPARPVRPARPARPVRPVGSPGPAEGNGGFLSNIFG